MKTPKTLFLAWQDSTRRFWFSIGRLTCKEEKYEFVYTHGAQEAKEKCAFSPLNSFPRFGEVYTSTYLFAVFTNRLMSRARPDYSSFMQRLNLSENESNPFTILARSGGQRQTDTLTVFPLPERAEDGLYHFYFPLQGLQDLPLCSIERINQLQDREKLFLAHEFQNPYNFEALSVSTQDHYIVGYCPRYLFAEVIEQIKQKSRVEIRVEHVNAPSTPFQYRLMCEMTFDIKNEGRLFDGLQYQPLVIEKAAV
ncbi:hypothetical protein NIES4071_67620 [Calothrix sp. NIES-4071]|nr:hypothetical protein NIES4071_67620 [Calothrix sp. NIES-4071]BAZ61040.1 hypothetical protein NIES4105_67580 [Calothrix sp. NIES-4105]